MTSEETPIIPLDLLIIGAGISGIGFAQTYLTTHPDARVLIVDRDSNPGGSWNARRLYPTFRSQLGLGMAEFSDMPMQLTPDESVEQSLMTGKAVTRYLEEYLDRQSHNGSSLRARLQLNFDVKKVERGESAWTVNGRNADGTRAIFRSLKLVVATGTTSEPHFPQLPNRDLFKGLVVHQSGFGASPILSSDSIQNVTILGGAKSAADMVYACVKAGKTVTWLIRESGAGPATFLSAEGRGAYRNHPEYASTRIMGSLSPSPWAPENSRTRFMGRTVLGRSIMVSPWANADKMIHSVFDEAREMGFNEGFQQLRPRGTVFWANSQLGLIDHPDFWQTVAENVKVCRADIASMNQDGMVLHSGETLPCDALICGTGWDQTYKFLTDEQQHDLGLPVEADRQTPSESATWSCLNEDADQKLRKKWPAITNPPPYWHKQTTQTPYRLYKYMAPMQDPDHSIVFIGQTINSNAFRNTEVQSLWATAYLDNRLPMPSLEQQRREVAEVNVWCRRRYLLNGMSGNCMHHDLIGYTDSLLDELSLDAHRSGRSFWQWWSRPNFASDLRGLREEYLEKYEGIKRKVLDLPELRSPRKSLGRRSSVSSSTFSLGRKSSSSWTRPRFTVPPEPGYVR